MAPCVPASRSRSGENDGERASAIGDNRFAGSGGGFARGPSALALRARRLQRLAPGPLGHSVRFVALAGSDGDVGASLIFAAVVVRVGAAGRLRRQEGPFVVAPEAEVRLRVRGDVGGAALRRLAGGVVAVHEGEVLVAAAVAGPGVHGHIALPLERGGGVASALAGQCLVGPGGGGAGAGGYRQGDKGGGRHDSSGQEAR